MDESLCSVIDLLLHQSSKDIKYRSADHEEYEKFLEFLRVIRAYEDAVREDVYLHVEAHEIAKRHNDDLYDVSPIYHVPFVCKDHYAYRTVEMFVKEARQRYDYMLDEIREDPDIEIVDIF